MRGLLALSGSAALCACISQPAPPHAPAPEPVHDWDWHALVIMPFGTLLKDSPVTLHEALLFQDAQSGGDAPRRDCYAIAGRVPPFFGGPPQEYLLCFSHDRLVRIDASVHLTADNAGSLFAAACAQWRGTGASGEPTADSCEGADGTTRFSARLSAEPASAAPVLSISLFAAAGP